MDNSLRQPQGNIPQCPECKCSIHFDGCTIGFTSKKQRDRFLKLRTCIDKNGHRRIISGVTDSLNRGITRTVGRYYFQGTEIPKEVAVYNLTKQTKTSRQKLAEEKAEEEAWLMEDSTPND